jgi:hypothetical protein
VLDRYGCSGIGTCAVYLSSVADPPARAAADDGPLPKGGKWQCVKQLLGFRFWIPQYGDILDFVIITNHETETETESGSIQLHPVMHQKIAGIRTENRYREQSSHAESSSKIRGTEHVYGRSTDAPSTPATAFLVQVLCSEIFEDAAKAAKGIQHHRCRWQGTELLLQVTQRTYSR